MWGHPFGETARLQWDVLMLVINGTRISLAIGVALETTLIRKLYQRDHLYQVLLTFGLILIFEELRSILVGDDVHGVPMPAALAGSIEIGKQADLVLVDAAKPHLAPRHDPVALLVYSAQAADVSTVLVAGRILLEDRHLTTLDQGSVLASATAQTHSLLERSRR